MKPEGSANLTIVASPAVNLADIPGMMVRTAGRLQEGELGTVVAGVFVTLDEQGCIRVFGWGRTEAVHTLGVLQMAAVRVAQSGGYP